MIVDVGLGEASGIAAVKEILRSGFVPHVFVTGDALSGVSLGPDTVLMRKPFRVSDLDHAIQRALADLRNLGDALAFALRFQRLQTRPQRRRDHVGNGIERIRCCEMAIERRSRRARTAIRGLTIPSKGSKFKRC